ncbi:tryptophan synthase beta subunit-like PLP-dependent enzyme [Penicillium fimorum]|uniref:Tryptophan synthase beta subunit-like PLP-dependent enzyme n=1 Tax=Penicillium fimorum TaxID=1882269 RepID=A0A9W9XV54_9EURO|nr:tryptophan synthase beta subunit-like PLP-dependent enzyme [Penicillium fimorum]
MVRKWAWPNSMRSNLLLRTLTPKFHPTTMRTLFGLEILEQCDLVDNVIISIRGYGHIGGVGSVLKTFSLGAKIYGVATTNPMSLATSIAAGCVVKVEHLPTLAEAVAGGIDEHTITLPLASLSVDYVLECNEAEILQAMKLLAFQENVIVEASAALALAGFNQIALELTGQTSVVILCGGNVDQGVVDNVIYGLRES